ncbi:chorismate mutase [Sandarakinorhabdus sp.]|jgi:isochorismate pyruvate lyase|uniref:chorismate mutase n=1 Tax=Sandarakinorhabdus sp. TaxID=1916663 RepID=UPI00356454B6
MSMTPPEACQTPEACQNMAQVRAGVDVLDVELVALLARRFFYMDAAARIKPDRSDVRDEARKAQVIANASAAAAAAGLPPGLAETLWEALVEASIAHELARWESLHAQVA